MEFNISNLKNIGHMYLDICVSKRLRVDNDKKHYKKTIRRVYHELAIKMHTDCFKCHFHNMNNEDDILKAIICLQNMCNE